MPATIRVPATFGRGAPKTLALTRSGVTDNLFGPALIRPEASIEHYMSNLWQARDTLFLPRRQ